MKQLACLVIGDEILAGHVHESNSHYLAKRCKEMGVGFRRVEICTDELPDIEASVRRMLHDVEVDYVVTSGGLGPTPDDRTMEGIARAIGVALELTPENLSWMEKRVAFGHKMGYFKQSTINAGMKKMAYLPAGAEAMENHIGTCLGAIVSANGRLLFTLPGVPHEFERMFEETVAPRLERTTPLHVEEVQLKSEESRFYELLQKLEADYPDVMLGSYPQRGSILIRATGTRPRAEALIAAVREAAREYVL